MFSEKESEGEANLERKIANKELLLLLDVRQREPFALKHRDGARNIPLDELPVRAQNELSLNQTIVIYGSNPYETEQAYSILDTQDFKHVFILVQNTSQPTNQAP